MTLDECRRFYAEEIRFAANVSSPALVEAFARLPREKFLGPGPWRMASSDMGLGGVAYVTTPDADPRHVYHNTPVALDTARDLNNGQPGTLARWIDAPNLKAGDRVYHMGCGVGYYTAILAEVVGGGGSVLASEVDLGLAARASENLAGYRNVTVVASDGAALDPGICDAMLINAGVTHPHPLWLDRLREGGRLLLPLTVAMGANLGKGMVALIVREQGGYSAKVVTFVAIYSATSLRDPQLEPLLGKALGTGALMKIKSVRRDAHEQADTCVLHGREVCWSTAPLTA
ncbi:MAG: rRNA adenine N-6-methyltransferase family protein [Bryobacteraceae bacterium]|jgi:protein-L-isoaspartate(D-aspartate) O-methyltransferase